MGYLESEIIALVKLVLYCAPAAVWLWAHDEGRKLAAGLDGPAWQAAMQAAKREAWIKAGVAAVISWGLAFLI